MRKDCCDEWNKNIDKVNGPIMLQTARSGGGYQYDGVPFKFCPWCGTPKSGMIDLCITGLSESTWDDFKEHRKAVKAKLTPNAEKRLLKRLARMVEEGGNAEEIVGRSIESGWKGLFPGGNNAARQHIDNSVPARIQRAHDAKRANRGAHGKVVDADG